MNTGNGKSLWTADGQARITMDEALRLSKREFALVARATELKEQERVATEGRRGVESASIGWQCGRVFMERMHDFSTADLTFDFIDEEFGESYWDAFPDAVEVRDGIEDAYRKARFSFGAGLDRHFERAEECMGFVLPYELIEKRVARKGKAFRKFVLALSFAARSSKGGAVEVCQAPFAARLGKTQKTMSNYIETARELGLLGKQVTPGAAGKRGATYEVMPLLLTLTESEVPVTLALARQPAQQPTGIVIGEQETSGDAVADQVFMSCKGVGMRQGGSRVEALAVIQAALLGNDNADELIAAAEKHMRDKPTRRTDSAPDGWAYGIIKYFSEGQYVNDLREIRAKRQPKEERRVPEQVAFFEKLKREMPDRQAAEALRKATFEPPPAVAAASYDA